MAFKGKTWERAPIGRRTTAGLRGLACPSEVVAGSAVINPALPTHPTSPHSCTVSRLILDGGDEIPEV